MGKDPWDELESWQQQKMLILASQKLNDLIFGSVNFGNTNWLTSTWMTTSAIGNRSMRIQFILKWPHLREIFQNKFSTLSKIVDCISQRGNTDTINFCKLTLRSSKTKITLSWNIMVGVIKLRRNGERTYSFTWINIENGRLKNTTIT